MTNKQYLDLVRRQKMLIKDLRHEYIIMQGDQYNKRNLTNLTDQIYKLDHFRQRLTREEEKFTDLRQNAEKMIGRVTDDSYRFILTGRYVGGCGWEYIADVLSCTVRWALVLHGRALRELDNITG